MNEPSLYPLINYTGLAGLVILGAGLAAVLLGWRVGAFWWARLAFMVAGAACGGWILHLSRYEFHVLSYFYLIFIGMLLLAHGVGLVVSLGRLIAPAEELPPGALVDPLLRKAVKAERSLDFAGAVKAYDEYLEGAEDAAVRARLAEALIRAGNSKRALSVLTVAFTQAEKPALKIALGIRLAEVILVTQRDPVAARTQLEQLRKMFAGTEHEKFVEGLAARMMKRVADGRYLKKKPDRPRYDG